VSEERLRQVEQLYHEALEHEPGQRATFLDAACAGDEDVRREVESLLGYQEQAESFMETPAPQLAAKELAASRDQASDRQLTEAQKLPSLGSYQLLFLLGRGGMGEVYLAEDTRLGRKAAIKLLPTEFTADEERVRRFGREARAASAINHPNILTIYEIGQVQTEAGGVRFIATEYVEGQTLRQRMKQSRLSLREALEVALQIAGALNAAHTAGIIHRDIKPENVMVRPDGLVKVLDFGLAKLTERSATAADPQASTVVGTTSEPGMVMGTVSYMSPEQARGLGVDGRCDIFSLGAVLYEMIAGRRPFAGATAGDTIAAILRDEPELLSHHLRGCPPAIERMVNRCLAKAPEGRYQTAGELSAELKAARAAIEESSWPMTRRAERSGNQLGRWVAIGCVMTLMASMVAFYYFRGGRDPAWTAIKSIAVLPPRPLQPGERDEALERGTTSTLITRLGSLRQLIVRPESAVEKYARPDQDPLAAGREQKVDAVLDSHYQRSGDKLRFRLRLLRMADGATLWADTLDQSAADRFAVEDALSGKVTGALRLTLNSAEKELLAKRYTSSAEAWQLYLRGRHLTHTRRTQDTEKAITYFERAIALDPDFALAHAELGSCYATLTYFTHPPKELMPKAKFAFDRALMLDDRLAEAHTYIGLYKRSYEWDFVGAEREDRRALDLDPNSATAHHLYAFHLAYMGRFEQAISEIRRAEELDPTSPFISRNVSQVLFFARRYNEAIEQTRRVIDLHPNVGGVYVWMIRAFEMKGDEQGAFAARLKQAEADRAGADEVAGIKAAFSTGGLKGYWRWQLGRLLEREKKGFVVQLDIAALYALLGQKEEALARLYKAAEERDHFIIALNVEPVWDGCRADPRFVALVRRVGLAP